MLISRFSRWDRIIVTSCKNPFVNLAKELDLLYGANGHEKTLFLWRNYPTVVIGKHQNPYKECNIEYMNNQKVVLSRRPTGGGAVYQDLGNTNWTFVDPVLDTALNTSMICSALSSFGIEACLTGRNDVEVNGRKVSGAAFRKTPGRSIHHGTLLIDVDIGKMVSCLSPDKKKLEAKGVDSVRSRVVNLQELSSKITHESFCQALIDEFQKKVGKCPVTWIDESSLMKDDSVRKRYEMLASKEWLFGRCSTAAVAASKKFDFGLFDVTLRMDKGCVASFQVHSDCLSTDLVEKIEKCINTRNFDVKEFKTPEERAMAKEVLVWLQSEMKKWTLV